MADSEALNKVEGHLQDAEDALSRAVAAFGPRCGGFRYMIGSITDYKKMVGAMLRVRHIRQRVSRAAKRTVAGSLDERASNEPEKSQ